VSVYREQVAAALEAVTILGAAQYAWMGRRSRPLPAPLDADLDDAQRRAYLVGCLREELYHSFYVVGGPVPARWGEPQPLHGDPRLLAALSEANAGRGSWEHGWEVERIDDGEVVVKRDRLRVRVPAADCRPAGASVRLRLPSELPSLSPGFWSVLSDAPSAGCDVRVYWHVTSRGAPALVEALTRQLNGAGAPFRLKVADHPFRFARHDAAVLYLDGEVFRDHRDSLFALAGALAGRIRPGIPAWTLELAPGVGLAEDQDGESFGDRRCAQLAAAIVRAHDGPLTRLDAVAACFAEDGVDLDAPYRAGRNVL
jgi:hypothetical protein